jgi:CheY-like chemotaxis protein
MNGLIGMTNLLLDTPLEREQREYAETVRSSADSLLTILNDILDFSKIEAGRLLVESTPFDLEAVVYEVAELVRFKTAAQGIELVVHYRPGTPRHVIGDAGRVRQILTNLVGNAVKFTSAGHVLVDIASELRADGRAQVRIQVADTGSGIAADKLPLLFQKFVQADSSTTRKFGGTGLGLAISRQLAELMGGGITASSVEGRGSVFTLAVPLEIAAPLEPRGDDAPTPCDDDPRALVLLRSVLQRGVLLDQLRQLGVQACASESENELVLRLRAELAAHAAPIVVFVDADHLPDESGALLAELESRRAETRLQVALLTSIRGAHVWPARWRDRAAHVLKLPARSTQVAHAFAHADVPPPAPPLPTPVRETDRALGLGAPARVLLAEDNAVNARIVVKMLERLGCRVDIAVNGRDAVAMWRNGNYSLILMDCQMPELDGLAATAQIRELEGTEAHVPIVALTANAMSADRELCIAAGMDDYITKPIARETLEKCVLALRARA